MTITKPGFHFQGTCAACGCMFTAKPSEVNPTEDSFRSGKPWTNCPNCSATVRVDKVKSEAEMEATRLKVRRENE